MPRCPRCLKPLDEDRNCIDTHCAYRVEGSSLRPLLAIFTLVGLAHLGLVWRFGVPAVDQPAPAMYWFFVAVCWLFVNSTVTVAIYAAWVFAFELEMDEYAAWLRRGMALLRAMARGTELPPPMAAPRTKPAKM